MFCLMVFQLEIERESMVVALISWPFYLLEATRAREKACRRQAFVTILDAAIF